MKTFKYFIPLFTLFLMACIDEPAPQMTEKEIALEISRTWNCDEFEEGFGALPSFEVVISTDPSNDAGILISNFHGLEGTQIQAIVRTDLSIELPEQTVFGQTYLGSGDISNDFTRITWDYTIENADGTTRITGTYTYGTTS